MVNSILSTLLQGNNHPQQGSLTFDSTDHIRFQNGRDVSGHNYGCNRRVVISHNIDGGIGYTVTIYNMDGIHPVWQNNIQMSPKPMKIENINGNVISLRGFGYDRQAVAMGVPPEAASFSDYGILIEVDNHKISRIQLNMYDRNVSLLYLK